MNSEVMCRGVRGATSTQEDSAQAIIERTRELLEALVAANGIAADDVASVILTTSPDLTAAYPAAAAREMGWTNVPLMCMQEINVPGGLPRAVRVLLHWNTRKAPAEIVHVYLHEARRLRPDLARREDKR